MRRTERPGPAVPSPIARLLGDDDEGQLEPQNSIVLHSKLAGYRSSMAVSSWLCACCPPHIGRCSPNLHRHEAAVAALLAPTAAEQEPYFKTRQQRAAKAGDGGEMVQMRKKTAAMGRDFASLLSAPRAAGGQRGRPAAEGADSAGGAGAAGQGAGPGAAHRGPA